MALSSTLVAGSRRIQELRAEASHGCGHQGPSVALTLQCLCEVEQNRSNTF